MCDGLCPSVHGTWRRRAQGTGCRSELHRTCHMAPGRSRQDTMLHAPCNMRYATYLLWFMAWFMGVGAWATLLYVHDRSVFPPVCRMPYVVCRLRLRRWTRSGNVWTIVHGTPLHRESVHGRRVCRRRFWHSLRPLAHPHYLASLRILAIATCPAHHRPLAVTHYPTRRRSLRLAHIASCPGCSAHHRCLAVTHYRSPYRIRHLVMSVVARICQIASLTSVTAVRSCPIVRCHACKSGPTTRTSLWGCARQNLPRFGSLRVSLLHGSKSSWPGAPGMFQVLLEISTIASIGFETLVHRSCKP